MMSYAVILGRLSTLIKGWSASSSTFHRRDSCEFTRCVSPCVRKATTHLEELRDQLARLSAIQEENVQEAKPVDDVLSPFREGIASATHVYIY